MLKDSADRVRDARAECARGCAVRVRAHHIYYNRIARTLFELIHDAHMLCMHLCSNDDRKIRGFDAGTGPQMPPHSPPSKRAYIVIYITCIWHTHTHKSTEQNA